MFLPRYPPRLLFRQAAPVASLGDAYVGPSTLNLRQELALKSAIAATVKHGDKLAIVGYRHRLVKVRTEQGAEGWTDLRQLLTPEQMAVLRDMAKNASRSQSQGQALVFEALNMHTEPSRTSPSFGQIPENGKVDVIAHKLTPRVQHDEIFVPPPPKPRDSQEAQAEIFADQDRAAAAAARAEAPEQLVGALGDESGARGASGRGCSASSRTTAASRAASGSTHGRLESGAHARRQSGMGAHASFEHGDSR